LTEILEPWHEVPLTAISGRTRLAQTAKLAMRHGWDVKLARTVARTPDEVRKNGNVKPGKVEENFWLGGAKPGFVFLMNNFYIKKNGEHCDIPQLKQFILEN
jgi:hypothetical protein